MSLHKSQRRLLVNAGKLGLRVPPLLQISKQQWVQSLYEISLLLAKGV